MRTMMALSKARKRFRIVLCIALVFSLTFFSAAAYVYVGVRTKTIKIADISPILFRIDITQHQLMATISDNDGKFTIGKQLYQKGLFSTLYAQAGDDMILDLAENGHAPAQTAYADIIYARTGPNSNRTPLALNYYRKAAEQGYKPARERLANFANTDTMTSAGDTSP